ncbi:MAG: GDP-L-fucose synthase [Ignavibacteria bacterium]|nr:GDP-L-fucose synthase [Ignavibacteria bacterium]
MNTSSKIYVAGHTGLVGSAIVRKLKREGYEDLLLRTNLEVDLRDQKQTFEFFAKEKPEYVFLAAAKVGGILANNTYKAEFIYDNIAIASNVIHASYTNGVKKLLNLGSSCIYPKLAAQPLKEDYLLTGPLESTNEPYAIAKIAAIKLCRYYNEQYGTNFISVMPTNLYGPGDNFNFETSHVLPALVRKFHLARLLGAGDIDSVRNDLAARPMGQETAIRQYDDREIRTVLERVGITEKRVVLWGTGKPMREFLYVDDLADALVFLMQRLDYEAIGELINIGWGEDISIKDLAELIRSVVGFEGEISFDSSKPDGTPRKLMDVSRLKQLGWSPKTSLRKGVEMTCEWYSGKKKKEEVRSEK